MAITINHDNDTWQILGEGASRGGKVFCHLASTTRGRHQRNGWVPMQINDWIDHAVILSAAQQAEEEQRKQDAITAFYADGREHGRRPSTWVR